METGPGRRRDVSVWLSHGGELLFALYVRDYYRLDPPTGLRLPPAEPMVAPRPPAGRPDLAPEWSLWWETLVAQCTAQRPADPADGAGLDSQLAGFPLLHPAVQRIQAHGQAWVSARKQDHHAIYIRNRELRPGLVEVLAQTTTESAVRFSVVCVPVHGLGHWRLTPNALIVSYNLYADWPRFIAALED
jgi:hypothetical protein